MPKIAILTDSGCDIPKETIEELNINVLPFHIYFCGQNFLEMVDKTTQEFYEMMAENDGVPSTNPVQVNEIMQMYQNLYNKGYTDIIAVFMNKNGSETFNNAESAKETFIKRNSASNVRIFNIDSRCYTMAYGYPVIEAAKKVRDGETAEEIVSYLEDWFKLCAAYIVPATLKYARKSGRVSSASAIIGDVLKIKPIIEFANHENSMIDKIWGDKNIVSRLVDCVTERMEKNSPYVIIHGQNFSFAREVEKELYNKTGRQAELYGRIGCTIASHIGPDIVGVIIKRRR